MANVDSLAAIANFDIDVSDRSLFQNYEPSDDEQSAEDVTPPGAAATNVNSDNVADLTQTVAASQAFPVSSIQHSESHISRGGSVSFGKTRNASTQSIQHGKGSAIGSAIAKQMNMSEETLDYSEGEDEEMTVSSYARPTTASANSAPYAKAAAAPKQNKSVLKNSGKTGPIHNKSKSLKKKKSKRNDHKDKDKDNRLTKVSAMYDLDGDGQLDAIEQAMRDRDVDGDGQLDTAEVYKIVQDQMRSQQDLGLYRKVAAGLLCLVAILAASNFGTSWASAILSSDTVADSETGTIQSKKNGQVMGLQQIAHTVQLTELDDMEFEERRRLVDAEMEEDPEHPFHQHRKLGKKKKNSNHKCSCSQIAYDQGRIPEDELEKLTAKCNGGNTVNLQRKFKNRNGGYDEDILEICSPGTKTVRKGKKKKNKNKTKVKVVDEQVTFRKKGKNGGRDKEVSFDCNGRGDCYTSGLQQRAGHPCNPSRDNSGASQCQEGLVCYDPDGYGDTGVCTLLSMYAGNNQMCDIDHGVDACDSGLACLCDARNPGDCDTTRDYEGGAAWNERKEKWLQVRTGFCSKVKARMGRGEVCDVSNGNNACVDGYLCLGSNGNELWGDSGLGFCTSLPRDARSGGTCNLSEGRNACERGYYCEDVLAVQVRNGGGRNGNGGGGNNGGNGGQQAGIYGPSGSIVTNQGWGYRERKTQQAVGVYGPSGSIVTGNTNNYGLSTYPNGRARGRTTGTGTCSRTINQGGQCSTHEECGAGNNCVGLGAVTDTSTGGVIRGSSGTIVWGDGGRVANTGFCG